MEDCSICSCDSVEIYDGTNQYGSRLSKSCGSSLPVPVYSTGRNIFMKFTSDKSVTGGGFVAHYRVLNSSSGCPAIIPGASAGVIYSPNFPWSYTAYSSCDWRIEAPSGERVHLKFIRFHVGYYSNCDYSYVEVRDGYYNSLLGKYCGSQIPASVSSSSNSLTVKFRSSYATYSGFLALYQTGYSFPTDAPAYRPFYPTTRSAYHSCSSHSSETTFYLESSSSTTIRSGYGGFWNTRAPYSSCTFKISTETGYNLELTLDAMNVYSCSSCSCGYLKVRDGSSSSDPLLGEYCGTVNYGTVTSTGNHLYVDFNSDSSRTSFRATVRSRRGSSVNVAAIVVPIVVAVVLFSIIFVVIKCTKINRSAGPAGSSRVNDVPLQPFSDAPLLATIGPSLSSGTQQVDVPPPHPNPATAPDELPPSTDYSQGFTNFAEGGGYVQG
ncbi:Tolloid-like protein 2 [Stylophora pistillata]|uniref:Tolloid-like protein 2 n=2 Tax=Stylophora pistillata TaxID=50429 RepID=A0A2B4SJE3_STYPI|nr:Tolloid-like protein 2 [Stylophora pistillata]